LRDFFQESKRNPRDSKHRQSSTRPFILQNIHIPFDKTKTCTKSAEHLLHKPLKPPDQAQAQTKPTIHYTLTGNKSKEKQKTKKVLENDLLAEHRRVVELGKLHFDWSKGFALVGG